MKTAQQIQINLLKRSHSLVQNKYMEQALLKLKKTL
jgi:hypothetical protein